MFHHGPFIFHHVPSIFLACSIIFPAFSQHFPSIFHRFSIIFQSFPRSPTTARGTSAAPRLPWSAPHGRCADGPRLCWSTSGPSRSSSSGDRRPMRFIFGGDEKKYVFVVFVSLWCTVNYQVWLIIKTMRYVCVYVCMYSISSREIQVP